VVKTRVIMDGPLPAQRKTTPSAAATVSGQQTPTPQTQRPPAAQPTQRKGPELVPDDGSRPPPTMLVKPKPQPQQSAPATQQQPPGGRQ
jgi:hypothetical protein